jgi:transposase-like protein
MSIAVDNVLSLYEKLDRKEKIEFNSRMTRSDSSMEDYITEVRFANGKCCPHCGSVAVVKNGNRADGTQNYRCKDCHSQFNIKSNSIVAHTHKNMDVWQKFIECMLQGLSLRKTAEICSINRNTAFAWRHKVLDTLQNMANDVILDGIVEMDETFFAVSYKGNHKNSKTFKMPRKAHHHGGIATKRGISKEKVCVPCAVNRSGLSVAQVSNLGHITIKELHAVFDTKIADTAELCTDKMSSYKTFAAENGLNIHQFKVGKCDKSDKNSFHIQHINNYHSTLKGFMYPFKGVSTKYLNNYLIWHNFVNYAGETYTEKKKILMNYAFSYPNTVLRDNINNRDPMPLVT